MKLKYLLIFFSIFFLLNLAAAIEIDDMYHVEFPIDYNKPCFNNGTYCSASALCNLTVSYPNNTILVNNQPMTNKIAYHNYTLPPPRVLGIYKADMVCIDSGRSGSDTFYYEITPTGTKPDITEGIIYFLAVGVAFLIFLLCLFGAIRIPWGNERNQDGFILGINHLKYIKLMLWFGAYLLLILLSYLMYNITYGFLSFNVASNIFNAIYWFLFSFLWPIMVITFITAVISIVNDKKIHRAIERGIRMR